MKIIIIEAEAPLTDHEVADMLAIISELDSVESEDSQLPLFDKSHGDEVGEVVHSVCSDCVSPITCSQEGCLAEDTETPLARSYLEGLSLTEDTFDKNWWFGFQEQIFQEIITLTKAKNADYTGGGDIDNPFANFDGATELGVSPLHGLCLRMQDKFQRIKAFARTGKLEATTQGDSIKDAFRDLIGYSALALGIIERGERMAEVVRQKQ